MVKLIMQNNNILSKNTDSNCKYDDRVKINEKVTIFAIAKAKYALIKKIINKRIGKIECI